MTQGSSITVRVSPDKHQAELLIPANTPAEEFSSDYLTTRLRSADVEVTEAVLARLNKLADPLSAEPAENGSNRRVIIAKSKPPVHGQDGRIDWTVDQKRLEQKANEDEADQVSFYDRSTYITVQPGDELGKLHRPTIGEDGRDVCGGTLAAKDGKAVEPKFNESLLVKGDGTIIAQQRGALVRPTPNKAFITDTIEISENVDFSTGNIDFDGSVTVRGGIKDCFLVKAKDDIEVHGLVEAAQIEAGRDFKAMGGFAGREQGTAKVGHDLLAKYLDGVEGEIMNALQVDRELLNCDLTVHGEVDSPRGSLIGGRVISTGPVRLATLGSNGNARTELVIGVVPRLEPWLVRLETMINPIKEDREKLQEEKDMLDRLTVGGRATPDQIERQTELMFEIGSLDRLIQRAEPTINQLQQKVDEQRTYDVEISKQVHQGACFVTRDRVYRLRRDLKGPVQVSVDPKGNLQFLESGKQEPVAMDTVSAYEPSRVFEEIQDPVATQASAA